MTTSVPSPFLALIDQVETEIVQRQRLLVELRQALVWDSSPISDPLGTGLVPNLVLRRARQGRNLTQAELADALIDLAARSGLNVACCGKRIARWERGEVRWPSPVYRRLLCVFFGTSHVSELGFALPQPERPRPVRSPHPGRGPLHQLSGDRLVRHG